MYKFHITLIQQLRSLGPMFTTVIPIYIGLYYFIGNGMFDLSDGSFFYVSIFPLVICILPVLLVHIQYLIINWGCVLEIDTENKTATYRKGHYEKTFSFSDIASIGRYTPPVVYSGYSTFSVYRFMKINLKDDTKIIITSLMINKIERLELIFERDKAEVHRRLLALVY